MSLPGHITASRDLQSSKTQGVFGRRLHKIKYPPDKSSAMASLSVKALRSQFESMGTKNVTQPQPNDTHNTSGNNNIDIDNMTNEACGNGMDEDVFSSYSDGDDTIETTAAEEPLEAGHSIPEHYVEIATSNPYGKECRDSAKQSGKFAESTNADTATSTTTVNVPVRAESMEEALARLSREIELAHREIEEEQATVLRDLLMLSN
ncbi:hypothetical protein SLS62_009367 [Diatrype stigma]|uniref:Uncharacterized protein n=1 Tax=Diatrype stigma TaxID=117547 RepID=A0AAN9YLB5_9PEZI